MLKANWMALLIVGTLLPAAALADDATISRADDQPAPVTTLSLELSDLEFQDSGILGRASQLRSLSFLTLAELGRTRLFLGVNKEGLVGLHFLAFPRRSSGRYLELARMPYLKNIKPDTQAE